MPHDLFWWEGLDGSRVLAHTFDNPVGGYNAETGARAIVETWKNYRGKYTFPESLLAFGYGDGGGGPTEEMLDRQRQFADFPVVPALRPVKVADWFAEAHAAVDEDPALPVWVGEIYLELHRGTLTTQGRTKFLHRRAERALITAETLGSMATLLGEPLAASLEPQWRVLLRNEFHDILPGSSIREVYEEAEAELGGVVAEGDRLAADRLGAIAARLVPPGDRPGVLVVNPDLSPRPLRLVSPDPLPGGQAVAGGHVLAGRRPVPGLTAAVVLDEPAPAAVSADGYTLENELLRVEIDAERRARQRLRQARAPRSAGRSRQPRSGPTSTSRATGTPGTSRTPTRARARRSRPPRSRWSRPAPTAPPSASPAASATATIVQTYRLWANSARLDIATDIDWHERRILLKARFPLAVRSDFATFECAHGVIRRPTHRNTSWDTARFEVVAHRFADLSEHGYGVALLNDGKYGHHALGNELGLSLLRSPVYPDPLADEGRQSFTYALYPHAATG